MLITQKCQYALRAVFDLARRGSDEPVRVADIAEAQAIPPRFLEQILGQLRQDGFVTSRRGPNGGYVLAKRPEDFTVGDVIRSVQGPIRPVHCMAEGDATECRLRGDCIFLPMWEEAQAAVATVFDRTTFRDLVDRHRLSATEHVASYSI